MSRFGRRELLRTGGRALAVAAGAGLAGCGGNGASDRTTYGVPDRTGGVGTPTPTDRSTAAGETAAGNRGSANFASLSPPDPAAPAYRQWLPSPDRLYGGEPEDGDGPGSIGGSQFFLSYARPFWVDAFAPDVPERFDRHRRRKLGLDYFGIGFGNYQWILRVDRWTAVLVARFDRDAVAATLVGSGYERAGTHHGTPVFAREDGPRAVAVGRGALAWSARPTGDPPVGVVRALFDAKAGRVPRHHETDAGRGFATLAAATGGPLVGKLYAGAEDYPVPGWDLAGIDGWARAIAFGRTTTYLRTVFAFDRPKDPDALHRRLRNAAAAREFYRTADAVDVTATERSATVVAAVADDRYPDLAGSPGTDVTYPQITWGYEYDPAAGEVTITHRGGDEVPADTLHVSPLVVAGELPQFADEYDAVGPGDSLAVPVPDPDRGSFEVRWESPAGAGGSTIGRYRIPDADGGSGDAA